jgi:hypothetical protein
MNWPRLHWLAGTLTLLLFPFAGAYMRFVAQVPLLLDAPRLVYRSRFLFLLLIAIANLALSHAQPVKFIQRFAQAIILVSPAAMLAAFFIDPARGVQSSVLTVTTMRALFLAGVLLAFAGRPRSIIPLDRSEANTAGVVRHSIS